MPKKRRKEKKREKQMAPIKAPGKHPTIKFERAENIGNVDALHDTFLKECFIQIKAYGELNSESVKSILVGRTGTGKTAYIRHLQMKAKGNKSTVCVEIDVGEEFINKLKYLSDFMKNQDDQDFTMIFKTLWIHIISVHLIRKLFSSKSGFQTFFESWHKNESKKQLEMYVKSCGDAVWGKSADAAKTVHQLTKHLKAGVNIGVVKVDASVSGTISEQSSEDDYLTRILSHIDMPALENVLENLYVHLKEKKINCYVLIDELDEKWADDHTRYQLIRALVEAVRHFYKMPRKIDITDNHYPIKVVMALREDLREAVYENTRSVGFQTEKYKSFECHLKWSENDLRDLAEKRIQHLFKHKYTTAGGNLLDIFPNKMGQQNVVDYMLERTLQRPRDVIVFVGLCLEVLSESGKDKLSPAMVKNAENKHSKDMYESIVEEWLSVYPKLKIYTGVLRNFPKGNFTFEQFRKETVNFLLAENNHSDERWQKWMGMINENSTNIALELLEILHKISLVKVKLNPYSPYNGYARDKNVQGQYKKDTKIQIHPMVQSYYGVDTRGDNS